MKEWDYGDRYLKKAWWAVRRRFKHGRASAIRQDLERQQALDPVKAYKAGMFDAQSEMMNRIAYLLEALQARFEQLECCNVMCNWRGPVSEAVHPKHEPGKWLCPECHEVTEPTCHFEFEQLKGRQGECPSGTTSEQVATEPKGSSCESPATIRGES